MKTLFITILACVTSLSAMAQSATFTKLTPSAEAQSWYKAGKWRQGLKAKGYADMDIQTFYEQYQKAPQMYDSIFQWLKSIDPVKTPAGKNVMKWSHAVANVQDLDLRTPELCQWEQHRKHIDLQWIVSGSERLMVCRSVDQLTATDDYSERKDVIHYTWNKKLPVSAAKCKVLDSKPGEFYLFFPSDIHQACGIANQPETVHKIVVKIEVIE